MSLDLTDYQHHLFACALRQVLHQMGWQHEIHELPHDKSIQFKVGPQVFVSDSTNSSYHGNWCDFSWLMRDYRNVVRPEDDPLIISRGLVGTVSPLKYLMSWSRLNDREDILWCDQIFPKLLKKDVNNVKWPLRYRPTA